MHDEVINRLIKFMISASWEDTLGRTLIRRGQISLSVEKIEQTKKFLQKTICTIHTENDILIPMGTLFESDQSSDGESFAFYFAALSEKITVLITRLENVPKMKFKTGESRTKNAMIQWFSQIQTNPEAVKLDIKKIEAILQKRREGD